MHNSLIWWNQDLDDTLSHTSDDLARELRIESGSLVIMPKIESCRRWRMAIPGNDPARKQTTGLGVFWISFWRLSRESKTVFSIISDSDLFRTKEATPDVRTGMPTIVGNKLCWIPDSLLLWSEEIGKITLVFWASHWQDLLVVNNKFCWILGSLPLLF